MCHPLFCFILIFQILIATFIYLFFTTEKAVEGQYKLVKQCIKDRSSYISILVFSDINYSLFFLPLRRRFNCKANERESKNKKKKKTAELQERKGQKGDQFFRDQLSINLTFTSDLILFLCSFT